MADRYTIVLLLIVFLSYSVAKKHHRQREDAEENKGNKTPCMNIVCNFGLCVIECEGDKINNTISGYVCVSSVVGDDTTALCDGTFLSVAKCEGKQCSSTARSLNVLSMVLGPNNSTISACTGPSCTSKCEASQCLSLCHGLNCKASCSGVKCIAACDGADCKASCSGNGCEERNTTGLKDSFPFGSIWAGISTATSLIKLL